MDLLVTIIDGVSWLIEAAIWWAGRIAQLFRRETKKADGP